MRRAIVVILLVALAGAISTVIQRSGRFPYRSLNPNPDGRFRRSVDSARSRGEAWVGDPRALALRLVGYGQGDVYPPDDLRITVSGDGAVVVIHERVFDDDAISAMEYRIDLAWSGGIWSVEWWGERWQCARNEPFDRMWTTSPCP